MNGGANCGQRVFPVRKLRWLINIMHCDWSFTWSCIGKLFLQFVDTRFQRRHIAVRWLIIGIIVTGRHVTFVLCPWQIDHLHLNTRSVYLISHKLYKQAICHHTGLPVSEVTSGQTVKYLYFCRSTYSCISVFYLEVYWTVNSHLEQADTGRETLNNGVSAALGPARGIMPKRKMYPCMLSWLATWATSHPSWDRRARRNG